jgi:hypothetical protein
MLDELIDDLWEFQDDYRVVGVFDRHYFGLMLNLDPRFEDKELMSSPESLLAHMTFEHELTHWYQQIGTAYGYLQLEADECAARAVGSFLADYRRLFPRGKFPRPLATWAIRQMSRRQKTFKQRLDAAGDLKSLLEKTSIDPANNVVGALMLTRIISICEAFSDGAYGNRSTSQMVANFLYSQLWRSLFANQTSMDKEVVDDLARLVDEKPGPLSKHHSAIPLLGGRKFGAWHLCEGQAHAIEMAKVSMLLSQHEMRGHFFPYFHAGGTEDYQTAFRFFIETARVRFSSEIDAVMNDIDRAQRFGELLPRPFIAFSAADDRLFQLPSWQLINDADRERFAVDLMMQSDIHRAADFLLHATGEFRDAGKFFGGNVEDVLRTTWGVNAEEFRLVE